jgi:hypothetical protein
MPAENLGTSRNLGGYTEFRRLVKFRRTMELWQVLKSPRLSKISAPSQNLSRKVLRPLTIWARQNPPTADFLLVWLKSSRSDPRRYVASQTCRPQVI